MHGYFTYYASKLSNHYLGFVIIIHDSFCPHIVCNDPYGCFLVMEFKFFDAFGCGPHVSKVINGWSWLLMGDFNICVDASQSISQHSIMDDLEQTTKHKQT